MPAFPEFETAGVARTVGAVHLFLAGVTNLATGVVLAALSLSGRLLPAAIDGIDRYVTPAAALRHGDLLTVVTDGALGIGVGLVLLGALACAGAWTAVVRRQSWRRGVALAVCSGANPLAVPLAFVAAVLITVARAEFAPGGVDGTVGDAAGAERAVDRGTDSAAEDTDYGG